MNDATTPAGTEAPSLGSLMEKLSDPAMPAWGRQGLLDQIEAHHKATVAADAAAPQMNAEPVEGFEAPESGAAYAFEQNVPPGVEIVDTVALGTLKGGLAEAGVPVEIGNAAFGDIARLHGEGAFATDAGYEAACLTARNQLHSLHGKDGAKAIIADAIAQAEIIERANPALADAIEHAWASPMAVQALANMKRFGRPRK